MKSEKIFIIRKNFQEIKKRFWTNCKIFRVFWKILKKQKLLRKFSDMSEKIFTVWENFYETKKKFWTDWNTSGIYWKILKKLRIFWEDLDKIFGKFQRKISRKSEKIFVIKKKF